MPSQPFISIPLDIADVRVVQTELTKDNEFVVTVASTLTSTPCRTCGRIITEQHGTDKPRLLRHVSLLGRPLYLRIHPKRFRCPWCDDHPTTTQQLDFYDPNALHTKAYEASLMLHLVNSTIADVVAKEDVSYDVVLGILDRWIAKSVDWAAVEAFDTLGIDEIALLKGHRDFVAVISAKTLTGDVQLLAVLPDRTKATVVAWLESIPVALREAITTVCTDMWEPYISAVEHVLPTAQVVIDRFHGARHYRDSVDTLRKQELRRLKKELPKAQHDDLNRTLWPFRKRACNLVEDEQERLDTLLSYSPATRT